MRWLTLLGTALWALFLGLRWAHVPAEPPASALEPVSLGWIARLSHSDSPQARELAARLLRESPDPSRRTLGLILRGARPSEFGQLLKEEGSFPLGPLAQAYRDGRSPPAVPDVPPALLAPPGPARPDPAARALAAWFGFLLFTALLSLPGLVLLARPTPTVFPSQPRPLLAWSAYLAWMLGSFLGAALFAGAGGLVTRVLLGQLFSYGLGMLMYARLRPWPTWKFSRSHLGTAWMGVGWALASVLGVSLLLEWLVGRDLQSSNVALRLVAQAQPGQLVLLGLVVCLLGPLLEELWYRQVLLTHVLPGRSGLVWAALYFALVHADPGGFVPLFVLGVVLGAVYRRTGQIWTSWLIHAIWNFNTFMVVLLGSHPG